MTERPGPYPGPYPYPADARPDARNGEQTQAQPTLRADSQPPQPYQPYPPQQPAYPQPQPPSYPSPAPPPPAAPPPAAAPPRPHPPAAQPGYREEPPPPPLPAVVQPPPGDQWPSNDQWPGSRPGGGQPTDISPGDWSRGLPANPMPQPRVSEVRPVADELFRVGTDPYKGTTYGSRFVLSIGCAGGLIAELMLATEAVTDVTGVRQEQLLTCFPSRETGRMVLTPNHRVWEERPPRDPLQHKVLSQIVADTRRQRRPVVECVEYLAESAYLQVGERLELADLMESGERRTITGRRRRVWKAPSDLPTASINAMHRLPRAIAAGKKITVADRVLLGLIDATNLTRVVRREFGATFTWPSDLRLPHDLQAVVDATRTVVGASINARHR